MIFDADFQNKVAPLFAPGFGTENVGPLLYSLVRMTRPKRVLEVGLGYTTPYLAQALKDNIAEDIADRKVLADRPVEDERRGLLSDAYYATEHAPKHFAIDDLSAEGQTAHKVLEVMKDIGLESLIELHEGDFRGLSKKLGDAALPLDFVWFDCGAAPEYVDFLNEYWPLINPDHGLLLLHFTYWNLTVEYQGRDHTNLLCGSIANEIKRQQMAAGFNARFEVLSLVEPHKVRQGSVTMVRKLSPTSMCRSRDYQEEMFEIFGAETEPIKALG